MYQVVIVEDDPMVASINRQYVEENPQMEVAGVFGSGAKALEWLERQEADLLIVDYYMPQMDGLLFLSKLRERGNSIPVIMVTAANDRASVEKFFAYGVTDYLTKPFCRERFELALSRFLKRRQLLEQENLGQEQLDRLLGLQADPEGWPEKGLQPETARRLLSYLKEQAGALLTCERIAEETGFSKVTVRRYMNYFVKQNQAESRIDYTTGGRPSMLYRYPEAGHTDKPE